MCVENVLSCENGHVAQGWIGGRRTKRLGTLTVADLNIGRMQRQNFEEGFMNDLAAAAPQAGVSPVIWLLIVTVVIVLMVMALRRSWGVPVSLRPVPEEGSSFPSVKASDAVRVCQLIDQFEASRIVEGTETAARGLALISNSAGWDDSN